MIPPDDEFRAQVATRAFQIVDVNSDQGVAERELVQLLDEILTRIEAFSIEDDAGMLDDESDTLSTLQAWLSVASYPVAVFYAPQSPFRKWAHETLAGIGPTVARRLTQIATVLKPTLASLMTTSGIDEVGLSFQFPWGVGGGVAWDVSGGSLQTDTVGYPRIQVVRYPAFTGAGHEFDIEIDDQTTVTAVSPD